MRWLGREDSNLRMAAPKAAALPLGDSPKGRLICEHERAEAHSRRSLAEADWNGAHGQGRALLAQGTLQYGGPIMWKTFAALAVAAALVATPASALQADDLL